MNGLVFSFFTARALYTGLYMAVKSDKLALARTCAYTWSISIPMIGLWQAGKRIQS